MKAMEIPVEFKRLFDKDWREAAGFEGLYWINKQGLILSKKGLKVASLSNKGYCVVDLYKNNKRKKQLVHRIVAKTFISNPNSLPNVCHKDDNPRNNNVNNLFWGTQRMNIQDMMNKKRGSFKAHKGEKNGFAKLKEKDVKEIKTLLRQNKSCAEIARNFEVDRTTISMIKRGSTWKHVK